MHSCCIIIPTFNNADTLINVIDETRQYSRHIIVVNDGSTDSTSELLKAIEGVNMLNFDHNKGKGIALKEGFKYAVANGFKNAITLDSDGQHFPSDIELFAKKLVDTDGSMIVGVRKPFHANKSTKSSFANNFSNFWFKIQTGFEIQDTQSGFRLYPISKLKGTHYLTSRYEFETEVLVRSAWKGIPIHSVPIEVNYFDKELRISHFRPFVDFFRISVLNTALTIMAFLYFRPRHFIQKLFADRRI